MKYIKIVFLIQICTQIFAQTEISGKVTDTNNIPLPFVNIIIKTENGNTILFYTNSNDKGDFVIKLNRQGSFVLLATTLSYKPISIPIEVTNDSRKLIKNIKLIYEPIELNEVIIRTNPPIKIKKDTIVFDAKSFAQGNEEVIEDLLKKIPGINVDTEGTIKIGNQEIEKIMIEGDDFFENGYKILSKNMPVSPIDKIEVLQRFSNNKHLKGIEQSNKIALNLKLTDDAKRQWFGNYNIGVGNPAAIRYDLKNNLMNFGKKNKYYFLTSINNIGNDVVGDISHLLKPFSIDEPSNIGDNQTTYNLIGLNIQTPYFKKSRTNFNNAKLISLNAIFNPTKSMKIKTIGFFNWDNHHFFRNSVDTYIGNNTNFINSESTNLINKLFTGFGKIDLSYDFTKQKTLEITSKYNFSKEYGIAELNFNNSYSAQNLTSLNKFFDHKINYTNKIKENKAFIFTSRYIFEKSPQHYKSNQFFFKELFPNESNISDIIQISEDKMQFWGTDFHFLERRKNNNLIEFQIGNEYRTDYLTSKFNLKNENSIQENSFFINNTNYITNDLYFKSKYLFKIDKVSIINRLEGHKLANILKNEIQNTSQKPFFFNPSIGLNWEINKNNQISTSYSINKSNTKIIDVYNNYILTSARTLEKGYGNFNQLSTSTFIANYQLGNWNDKYFINSLLFYTKNHDFFSTNTILNRNYFQSEKLLIKNREIINVTTDIGRYFKSISSNLKVEIGYSKSNFENVINKSELRKILSKNYKYGLELRSGFSGFFNYHLGTKWTKTQFYSTFKNSFTDNLSFADFTFVLNNKLNINIQSERYYFGNVDKENNTYYFLDIESKYNFKPNKISFSISGKNLFNTKKFKNYSLNDISNSITEYSLIPRYILLKTEFRF